MLSYFLTDESLYRLTISKEKVDLDRLNVENLGDHLTGMRKGIVLQLNKIYQEKAHLLYNLLIPGNLSADIKVVVVIPDGALSILPFEALLSPL